MANIQYTEEFAFYQQLKFYYDSNRGKIRSRYNDLTKKFLAYNDKSENPDAFLRLPQFEALEMYVFIKEFMGNPQVYELFDDWRNRRDKFSDASYYSVRKGGQIRIFDNESEIVTDTLFKQMKKYKEAYPNYIYALTMGLGKTILMATCIFYEFLLANKYPKDKRFCHNALVFAPDKTVLQSLREIITFDKTKVVPPEYARVLDANIKFHFLEETGTTLHTIDDSDFNIVISNTQKIIVKKKRKEPKPSEVLFGSGSLLSSIYGDENGDTDDAWDDASLMDNQRFKKLCRLPQLGVYVDEAHALYEVKSELHTEDKELVLLKEPKDAGYYEFSAKDELVITNQYKALTQEQIAKSFHADTYCFDSKPEKECFLQYITNSKIKEVYFTGMFTANQGDLSVQYYDPESGRIRHYYPDFLAKLEDGSYQLIEVKGDNKIDDTVVKAKAAAAQEMAVASGIEYKMYAGSEIMTTHILAYLDGMASTISYADHMQQGTLSMVAETSAPYGSDK